MGIHSNRDYPEMETPTTPNYIGPSPDIEQETMRDIAKAVLFRAIRDIKLTHDFSKPAHTNAIECHSEHLRVGREVREWFRDTESWGVFSFRNVCSLSGRDYRKIQKLVAKYMIPKKSNTKLCTNDDILMELSAINDITLVGLAKKLEKKGYKIYGMRKMMKQLLDEGIVESIRYRQRKFTKNGRPKTIKDQTKWKLTEEGSKYVAEITGQGRKAENSISGIQDRPVD